MGNINIEILLIIIYKYGWPMYMMIKMGIFKKIMFTILTAT